MSTSNATAEQLRAQYMKQVQKKNSQLTTNPIPNELEKQEKITKAVANAKKSKIANIQVAPKDVDVSKILSSVKLPDNSDPNVKSSAASVKGNSSQNVEKLGKKLSSILSDSKFSSGNTSKTKQKPSSQTVVYADGSKTIVYTQLIVHMLSLASLIAIAFGIFRIDQLIRNNI